MKKTCQAIIILLLFVIYLPAPAKTDRKKREASLAADPDDRMGQWFESQI